MFFTRGVSLESWINTGLFYREKLIYEEVIQCDESVDFFWFTYGKNDLVLANELHEKGDLSRKIKVVEKPSFFADSWLGNLLYSFCLSFFHYKKLQVCDVYKTNQMDGAWAPAICKLFFKKKLYVRTGYTMSIFLGKVSVLKYYLAKLIEHIIYRFADEISVSSLFDKNYVEKNFLPEKRVNVLRNFIDTKKFYNRNQERKDELLFVGRMNEQKNLVTFFDALAETNFSLTIIGKGELKDKLKLKARELNLNVRFLGAVPNSDLPEYLNNYSYYVLPSFYEGMPKTLLEAMACGCVCIGTNVQGINEVLDNDRGVLVPSTEKDDLANALKTLKGYQQEKGNRSEDHIKKYFSLKAIGQLEMSILKELNA